jgi:uncharacterized protein (UPF0305 family)
MQNKEGLGLQINMEQILSLLSASLYKGDVLEVATRELLQNSYDATKATNEAPSIKFEWDSYNRVLTCTDNGLGMSPDTVKDVFFTVGGTLKEGLDVTERSGGFGIAKVQFFMAAEYIQVTSSRNGVRTVATATQKELLAGQGHIGTMLVPNDEHGTEVRLQFPSYYEENGELKAVHYYSYSIDSILQNPIIGYKGSLVFDSRDYIKLWKMPGILVTQSYDWGDLDIYFNPEACGSYLHADVHCAGLYQFCWQKYLANDEGIRCKINVRPKYPAGHQKYAFANSRDNFSGYAQRDLDDVKEALHELTKCLKAEKIRASYSEQVKLQYTAVDDVVAPREVIGEDTRPSIDFNKLCQGKSVSEMLNLLKDTFAQLKAEAQARNEQKQEGKENLLRFINKTDKDWTSCYECFSKVATIIYDVIYNTRIVDPKYPRVPTVAGVICENGKGGCFLSLDGVHGVYLNPTGTYCNANHFATMMTETLVHEIAHIAEYCGHGETFFKEMDIVRRKLFAENLYEEIYAKFQTIYLQYSSELAK